MLCVPGAVEELPLEDGVAHGDFLGPDLVLEVVKDGDSVGLDLILSSFEALPSEDGAAHGPDRPGARALRYHIVQ